MADIVIAEDTDLQRALVRGLIEPKHTVVGSASDGAEAVELVREHDPDVAVLDVNMPRIDGLEASERILAERPAIGVVLSTAVVSETVRSDAEAIGVDAFLVKPYTKRELLDAIDRSG
ncbi:hypothetical protein JCM18237_25780 [Halorubrum luteum]